jgi:predicted Rossmann-fold nucleotide-binding protein
VGYVFRYNHNTRRKKNSNAVQGKASMRIAIIGTRNPDAAQIALASAASAELSAAGHTIATGGADGIDTVAMQHCKPGQLEVCLPWASYNMNTRPTHATVCTYNERVHTIWSDSVYKYHPNADALTRGAFALHARNYGIVEDSNVVIAMPGIKDGGTGQGMRIARDLGVPLLVYRIASRTDSVTAMGVVRDYVAAIAKPEVAIA